MTIRTALTAADLFVLLDREYRRRKPRECTSCYIPLPYAVDAIDGEANWELVPPTTCPHGCTLVIEELVREFQHSYDLRR